MIWILPVTVSVRNSGVSARREFTVLLSEFYRGGVGLVSNLVLNIGEAGEGGVSIVLYLPFPSSYKL